MTQWKQGRADIENLLAAGELEQVSPNREHAEFLVTQAATHLMSAEMIMPTDPEAAYTLAYDAARKALTALLASQGLLPTTRGGHRVVYTATKAQLDPPLGRILAPFDRMRRQRNRWSTPAPTPPH